jgi:hypothetical protein
MQKIGQHMNQQSQEAPKDEPVRDVEAEEKKEGGSDEAK